jgi:hypothetical protein
MSSGRFHHQAGIALGAVIFLIAMLAILAAVIAVGSRGFTDNMVNESASSAANVIITYGQTTEDAISYVQAVNSCIPTQINFYSASAISPYNNTNYQNTNAPSNGSCDVFSMSGGKLTPPNFNPSWFAPCCNDGVASYEYGYPHFFGMGWWKLGTAQGASFPIPAANAQLGMFVGSLTLSVCSAINTRLGLGSAPINVSSGSSLYPNAGWFNGTFGSGASSAWLGSYRQGCAIDIGGIYYYFRVLIIQ